MDRGHSEGGGVLNAKKSKVQELLAEKAKGKYKGNILGHGETGGGVFIIFAFI